MMEISIMWVPIFAILRRIQRIFDKMEASGPHFNVILPHFGAILWIFADYDADPGSGGWRFLSRANVRSPYVSSR